MIPRIGILVGLLVVTVGWGQTTQPTAPVAPPARTMQEIQQDLQAAQRELGDAMKGVRNPADMSDEAKQKALPALRKLVALFEEMGNTPVPEGEQKAAVLKGMATNAKISLLALMAYLDDGEAQNTLKTMAAGDNATQAMSAKVALLHADWWRAGKDEAKQGVVIDDLEKLVQASPADNGLAILAMNLQKEAVGAGQDRLKKMVDNELKSPIIARMKQASAGQAEAKAKMKELENKPLTIEGTTLDGKKFTSADMKDKVVLVDFWATWCGPCIGELPRVKAIYKKYHEQGLEIVGVSCDKSPDDLKNFLTKNPEMTWTQLLEPGQTGWHPLAKQYGVRGIPTMFLIDKKGVLRTIEARQNMEEMIPKLLEEK